jgi:hypothetical protein
VQRDPPVAVNHDQPRRREIFHALRDNGIAYPKLDDKLFGRKPRRGMGEEMLQDFEGPYRSEAVSDE